MNWKVVAGALALSVLMAASALVGSIALHTASADSLGGAPAVPAAQAATTPAPATTPVTTPEAKTGSPNGGKRGGPGGAGPGFGGPGFGGQRGGGPGFGGPGFEGHDGGATTADGANRVISATTGLITSVKADLTYATGKMDTATVADWVSKADGLLASAQSAVTAGQFGKAAATVQAASTLARTADLLMQQALGADKLPSYTTNAGRGFGRDHMGMGGTTATAPTQAQSSRELAGFYNELVAQAAVLKATGGAGDASTYLTAAQARYSAAYTAYQAGKYSDAHNAVAVGRSLLEVADSLARAATVPTSTDAPVAVPAPNF